MNKVVTSILIIITLFIVVIILFFNFKSLTGLEKEPGYSEPEAKKTVKEKEKPGIYSTKGRKKNQSYYPEDSDSLYSKLKANITKDDILITGGHNADNGNLRYSFIQAESEEYNGQPMVKINIKNIEISPESANDSNLDYLKTNNSRIFDHFGVINEDEYKEMANRFNEDGMKVMAMPKLGLTPGVKGRLYIGDDDAIRHVDISVKSSILPNGSFDIELEAKQNRN